MRQQRDTAVALRPILRTRATVLGLLHHRIASDDAVIGTGRSGSSHGANRGKGSEGDVGLNRGPTAARMVRERVVELMAPRPQAAGLTAGATRTAGAAVAANEMIEQRHQ